MSSLTLLEHFIELRKRSIIIAITVLVITIFTYTFYNFIFNFFQAPFQNISNSIDNQFFVHSVIDGVIMKLKFSTLCGIVLSLPMIIYQLIRFIFPGLKKTEKKTIMLGVIVSFLLAILGFYYGYCILIPISLEFLVSAHFIPESIGLLLTYSDNILFVFNLLTYLILIFQTPIILCILLALKLIKRSTLWKSSKLIIIGILIISAILTPPDIITQLMIACPLSILFFTTMTIASITKIGEP